MTEPSPQARGSSSGSTCSTPPPTAAGATHLRPTKEMMQPCPLHPHLISLVGLVCVRYQHPIRACAVDPADESWWHRAGKTSRKIP